MMEIQCKKPTMVSKAVERRERKREKVRSKLYFGSGGISGLIFQWPQRERIIENKEKEEGKVVMLIFKGLWRRGVPIYKWFPKVLLEFGGPKSLFSIRTHQRRRLPWRVFLQLISFFLSLSLFLFFPLYVWVRIWVELMIGWSNGLGHHDLFNSSENIMENILCTVGSAVPHISSMVIGSYMGLDCNARNFFWPCT